MKRQLATYYDVPARRNVVVRRTGNWNPASTFAQGWVTSVTYDRVYVRLYGSKRSLPYHPFDLDYLIDGQWVSGREAQKKRDTFIDKINDSLNRRRS